MANYTVALAGANISPLIRPEQSQGGYTMRYQIPYTAISVSGASASADTATVTLGTTPTTWIASSLLVDIPVAFAGVSALTCTIGSTTTATAFASSFSVLTAGVYQPPNGPNTVATPASSTGVASVTYQAVFTIGAGTSGNLATLTSGFMTILLGLYDPTATP